MQTVRVVTERVNSTDGYVGGLETLVEVPRTDPDEDQMDVAPEDGVLGKRNTTGRSAQPRRIPT